MGNRIFDWLAVVLLSSVFLAEQRRLARNRRVLAEGFAAARDIQHLALRLWAEEDLRDQLRRLRLRCWILAAILLVVGVPAFVFDLVTGGLGHVR